MTHGPMILHATVGTIPWLGCVSHTMALGSPTAIHNNSIGTTAAYCLNDGQECYTIFLGHNPIICIVMGNVQDHYTKFSGQYQIICIEMDNGQTI